MAAGGAARPRGIASAAVDRARLPRAGVLFPFVDRLVLTLATALFIHQKPSLHLFDSINSHRLFSAADVM
jgi:hypothetical protein